MDVQRLLEFSRRRKKALLLISAVGFSTYSLYKLYHSPTISKKRKTLLNLLSTLISVSESVSDSAESIGIIARDMKLFLHSNSDEIPNSLKQISKIARSDEFSASMVQISRAMTVGILRGSQWDSNSITNDSVTSCSFSDRILDRVFSPAGSGFASTIISSFARSLVMAFYSKDRTIGVLNLSSNPNGEMSVSQRWDESVCLPDWVKWICDEKCRELFGECIQLFVSTAVTAYLNKTMDINTYDEIFTAMTNPKYESKVREMLVVVCNGAIETLVKTSHQVLTGSNSKPNSNLSSNSNSSSDLDVACVNHNVGSISNKIGTFGTKEFLEMLGKGSPDEVNDRGWVDRVSSTLAVPSNRRFILDMTGRVTFETVRSFLDFALWKLSNGLNKGTNVVHGEAVERGIEVMRYIGAKSIVVATISFALCLHILVGTRTLVPT